jgi:hypothetical protein
VVAYVELKVLFGKRVRRRERQNDVVYFVWRAETVLISIVLETIPLLECAVNGTGYQP